MIFYLVWPAIGFVVITGIHWPSDPYTGKWDWTARDWCYMFCWPWPLISYLYDRWVMRGIGLTDAKFRQERVYDWCNDHGDEFTWFLIGYMLCAIIKHYNWGWGWS